MNWFSCSVLYASWILLVVCETHRDSRKESGVIVFPDSGARSLSAAQEFPLDLARELNEISNMTEVFEKYVDTDDADLDLDVSLRFGGDDVERKALVHAKMANCMPELRTVPLQLEEDSTAYYIPSCTRVERCGGCCVHPLLSCQPTDLEILQVQVMVTEYRGNDKRGGKKLKLRKQKIVEVEQHLSCKCGCKIQPEDCSRYQTYSAAKCRCECSNTDEEKKCYAEKYLKLWNPDNCTCMCKEIQDCGSGYSFDNFTCSCIPNRPVRRNQSVRPWPWGSEFDRQFYNSTN